MNRFMPNLFNHYKEETPTQKMINELIKEYKDFSKSQSDIILIENTLNSNIMWSTEDQLDEDQLDEDQLDWILIAHLNDFQNEKQLRERLEDLLSNQLKKN